MNYSTKDLEEDLNLLEEAGIISSSEKNLRSKTESIIRSIENLTQKKLRIEYEIKRQKKSLERKRLELKRVSRSTSKKISLALESGTLTSSIERPSRVIDNFLLQESNRILED